jgi:hypothetical protein
LAPLFNQAATQLQPRQGLKNEQERLPSITLGTLAPERARNCATTPAATELRSSLSSIIATLGDLKLETKHGMVAIACCEASTATRAAEATSACATAALCSALWSQTHVSELR